MEEAGIAFSQSKLNVFGDQMSDVMAVIEVKGEKLVCVDYDRPVWHSKINSDLKAIPSMNHFVVDGILATLSTDALESLGITKRYSSKDFESQNPEKDLERARELIYQAKDLNINYFHDFNGDIQIHEDLARFKMPLGVVSQISTEDLYRLAK